MKLPVICGLIDRRILVNYRVDPQTLERLLPWPFRPKLIHGAGVAGVCLIRLREIRPRMWPKALGLASENAAHRISVVWEEDGRQKEGVFIPRRDSSSSLNRLIGGRLFPGEHHHARFQVIESGDRYSVQLDSDDGAAHVLVEGHADAQFTPNSIFGSLDAASAFFAAGSLGYSATSRAGAFDGLELRTLNWQAQPFAVERLETSYFGNAVAFPPGTAEFDSALLMRGVAHEWHGRPPLCAWSRYAAAS